MLKRLHKMGLRAEHCYAAGIASIGVAFASWVMSRQLENRGVERADRWGIFIGEWAPTFIGLGNGLRTYETGMRAVEKEPHMEREREMVAR